MEKIELNRVILVKYGELTTKKSNRSLFVNALYNNLLNKFKGLNVNITKDLSRMLIEFEDKDLSVILSKINTVFGIHAYDVAYKVPSNISDISDLLKNIVNDYDFKSFKVVTKRSDKSFPIESPLFSKRMGGVILKNKANVMVDVHNPEITFNIEIRRDFTYIYTNEYRGIGGYPVGTLGKGLLMLSGGIDSPVSGYLAMKRGISISAVYFEAIPHTSIEARNKVITLTKKLLNYTNNIDLYIVPFTKIQEAIYKNIPDTYTITIMRRMMYRIMEKLVIKYKAHVIINGESIGQVASQTLTSMQVINNVTDLPVIRPLACFDKLEIIDIAKKIDTYETSILPYEDCCTVFVPKHPVINPCLDKCILYEQSIDYQEMMDEAINNIIKINVNEINEEKFSDVL